MRLISKILAVTVILLGVIVWGLVQRNSFLREERNVLSQNNDALLSDIKRLQIDSATMAIDVKTLQLSIEEYKIYRAEDLEKIRKMGIEIKNLKSISKHELEIKAPIKSELRDTVILRDSVLMPLQAIQINTPYIKVEGFVTEKEIDASIYLPVTLRQAVWVEYKHKFLCWQWKVKAVHQTISSDNPYVEIKYSEMIEVRK